MQNKANFRKAQINITFYFTEDYENKSGRGLRKNKPNQSQFLIILVSLNWLGIISFSVMVCLTCNFAEAFTMVT